MRASMIVVAIALALSFPGGEAQAKSSGGSHSVRGHVTKRGTYVAPHRQTNPDSRRTNNWSAKGNTNPYTGERGTNDPYAPKRQR